MSFWEQLKAVPDDLAEIHLNQSGHTKSVLDDLAPIERILLETKARTILYYENLKTLTSNEQAYLDFLLNVDDVYYILGLCPSSQKQFDFTASQADITIFGGAAGSGKSHCGVADLLQHIHHKSFNGVIFRRTTPQLKGVGGMWQKAQELYGDVVEKFLRTKSYRKLQTQSQEMKITFPSKSIVQFRHMEHTKDKFNIQG